MRNLKRALSLTLASVMLLGMMVVGSSAAGYPDVSEEENIEAIEVLQAVGVMGGDENGNFNPDDYVTREQMAVIMAQLLKLDYNYYKGTNPFSDVPEWAAPYVAACAANGVTAGIGGGLYGSKQNIQAVQAALMMLKALGYFQYAGDYGDSYVLATVKQGTEIGLFDGIDSNADSDLTRNQVAQMALNALKSEMVYFTGDPGATIPTANGDVVIGYRAEYTPRTSTEAKYNAIEDRTSDVASELNHKGQYYIQLGEQLYDGELKLYDNRTDDFDRPSRYWEYDGKAIGTYMKKELIKATYTTEVTGRDLYDLLTADVVNNYRAIYIAIDGITDPKIDKNVFVKDDISRNNKAGVGGTGNGVLTQVFVDSENKTVTIAIINTYLAKANKDYDTKKESLDLTVYGLTRDKDNNLFKSITTGDDSKTITVSGEDFSVEDVKKDDTFLVNVADNEIQIMAPVSPMSAVEITSFQSRNLEKYASGNLTTGGVKYNFSSAAEYSNTTLSSYTGQNNSAVVNLKDLAYDVYLDAYGYVIGVVEVEKPDNYVFITGVNSGEDNLAGTELKANAIFLDGRMKTITINRKDSSNFVDSLSTTKADNATFNKWCTYTVSDDEVYALTLVPENAGANKEGQSHIKDRTKVIDEKNLSIETWSTGAANRPANPPLAYGNDESVYISVELDQITTSGTRTDVIISGVDNVAVGIANVDIKPLDENGAKTAADAKGTPAEVSYGVYTLYGDDGYVIGMVIVGEDNGSNSDLVYVHNDSVAQEYYETGSDGKRTYRWERTVIIDGVEATLEEVNANRISKLDQMDQNNWYRVRRNSDGKVTAVLGAHDEGIDDDGSRKNEDKNGVGPWGLTATSTPIAYVTDYDGVTSLDDAKNLAGVDTVLYHEEFTNKVPSADGFTLFMAQEVESGIRYSKNVKVVLDQKNDSKRATYFGEGERDLKDFLKELHKNSEGTGYDYEISAVIENAVATSVIIRDLVDNSGSSGSSGNKTPVTTGGAKAAIDGGADAPAAAGAVVKIAYLTDDEKPTTAEEIQAIVKEYADLMGWALGDVQGTPSKAAGDIFWGVTDGLGGELGNIKFNTTSGLVNGVRVNYVDDSTKGYEIKALDIDSTTGAAAAAGKTNDAFNAGTASKYTKYDNGNGAEYSTKGGAVAVTGHDWKVWTAVDSKVTIDGNDYYGDATSMNIVGNAAAVTAGTAAVDASTLKPGTYIECDDTTKHPTYTAAASQKIADGKVYNSGYIKIDAVGVSSVSVGSEAVTADTGYFVPANSTVAIVMTDTSGKHYQAGDDNGKFGSVLTTSATDQTLNVTVRAKDVAVGEVSEITLNALVKAPTSMTGVTLQWMYNGKEVAADNKIMAATGDKVQAKVIFDSTGVNFQKTRTIVASATGGSLGTVTCSGLDSSAGSFSTATAAMNTGTFANATITFEITVAASNSAFTVTITNQ